MIASLLADHQIKELCQAGNMIEPFVPEKVMGEIEINGEKYKLPSYGLEPHGYTFRLSPEGIVVAHRKKFGGIESAYEFSTNSDVIFLPPGGILFGESLEFFRMPKRVVGLLVGKSTYTRRGVAFLGTVLDAGWQGHIHFTIVNLSHESIPVFPGWGIGQVLFLLGGVPEQTYKGYYQEEDPEAKE